jgi:hypothetical protein
MASAARSLTEAGVQELGLAEDFAAGRLAAPRSLMSGVLPMLSMKPTRSADPASPPAGP